VRPDPDTTIPLEKDRGRDNIKPLDYFHINSLDMNPDGDYLISVRPMSMILRVSGIDGHILWELSSRGSSSFVIQDYDLLGQHHARWVSVRQQNSCQHKLEKFC
jgi:hypothetical protein